jgi:hypothetical protein
MASFITAGNATNGLQVSSDNTGILELRTGTGSGTTAVTFSTGQRATFPSTISVGNTTPATTGAGITFPAAQSASSDANTLDDYEEGTWTPVYDTGFSAVTYSQRTGTYTKIGRFVQLNLYISAVSATASGNITITGLPFSTGAYTQNNYIGVVQVQTTSGTLAAGTVLMRITDSSSTLFFQTQSTAGVASMAGSQLGASSIINATIQYFTST